MQLTRDSGLASGGDGGVGSTTPVLLSKNAIKCLEEVYLRSIIVLGPMTNTTVKLARERTLGGTGAN